MGKREKAAAAQIEDALDDHEIDLEQVGKLLAKSHQITRLNWVLDAANELLHTEKYTLPEPKRALEAQRLLLTAQKDSGRVLTTTYNKHAFEDEECQLCEWVSRELEMGDEWIFEALIANENCPDSLLRKMIEEFSGSPAAWGVAGGIEVHPNASAKTIALASKYMETFDYR